MRGEYTRYENGKVAEVIKNTITKQMEEQILRRFFLSTGTSTFYLGLCKCDDFSRNSTISDITEVVGEGYQRIQITADSVGWGEPTEEPNCLKIMSAIKSFSATGTWTPYNRIFIADALSGGNLLTMSEKMANEMTLAAGNSQAYTYSFYFR